MLNFIVDILCPIPLCFPMWGRFWKFDIFLILIESVVLCHDFLELLDKYPSYGRKKYSAFKGGCLGPFVSDPSPGNSPIDKNFSI